MSYTFELVGISPILSFFQYQNEIQQQHRPLGARYLGTHRCTLDAFIESLETVSFDRDWNLDAVVKTVINFWLQNPDRILLWKQRLEDAGQENLLVARVADIRALRVEFESLFTGE